MVRLGPSFSVLSGQSVQVPRAEKAAFRFPSGLLVFDDNIASTILKETPQDVRVPSVSSRSTEGNYPLPSLPISEGVNIGHYYGFARLLCLTHGGSNVKELELDGIELVRNTTAVKDSLIAYLARYAIKPVMLPGETGITLSVFTADYGLQLRQCIGQRSLVTRVWAHAAIVYLSVVVSR